MIEGAIFKYLPGIKSQTRSNIYVHAFGSGHACEPSKSMDASDHPGAISTIEMKYADSQIDGYKLYIPNSCTSESEACPVIVFLQGGMGVGGKVSSIANSFAMPPQFYGHRTFKPIAYPGVFTTSLYPTPRIFTIFTLVSASSFLRNLEMNTSRVRPT